MDISLIIIVVVAAILIAWYYRNNYGSDDLLKKEEKVQQAIKKIKMEKMVKNSVKGDPAVSDGASVGDVKGLDNFDISDMKNMNSPEDIIRMMEKTGMKLDDNMKEMLLQNGSTNFSKVISKKQIVVNGKVIDNLEEIKTYTDKNGDGKFDASAGEVEVIEIDKNTGEVTLDTLEEIKDFVKLGHKISAIKLYKDTTGCSLKEAKDFVNSL